MLTKLSGVELAGWWHWIRRFHLVLLLLFGVTAVAQDTTPPELTALSFIPSSVDVTYGAADVDLAISFSDDESGFRYLSMSLSSPSGAGSEYTSVYWDNYDYSPVNRSGSQLNGSITTVGDWGGFSIPRYSEPGVWSVDYLRIQDVAGNSEYYHGSNASNFLAGLGLPSSVHVANSGGVDAEAPQITELSFSQTTVDVSSAPATVHLAVSFTDDLAGIDYMYVQLDSPSGSDSMWLYLYWTDSAGGRSGSPVAGSIDTALTYNGYDSAEFEQFIEPGDWGISSVQINDNAGRSSYYSGQSTTNFLNSIGAPTAITVINTTGVDEGPPTLTDLTFSTNRIDVSEGYTRVHWRVSFTDDLSGFEYILATFASPSGFETAHGYLGWDNVLPAARTGTSTNGSMDSAASYTWAGFYFPQNTETGVWEVSYLDFIDESGNFEYFHGTAAAVFLQTNGLPYQIFVNPDDDGDGLSDPWEEKYFGSITVYGGSDDPDHDNLANSNEIEWATSPINPDTDGDGLKDGDEVWTHNSNPHRRDSDWDGLDDGEEVVLGLDGYITRPDLADTDSDGTEDGREPDLNRDPTDPSDGGAPGTVSGLVLGAGSPLEGADLQLSGNSGRVYHSARAASNGNWIVENVPPGDYHVAARAAQYADEYYHNASNRGLATLVSVLSSGTVTDVSFDLRPGQSPGLVEVTSDPSGATVYLDYQPTGFVTPATIDVGELGRSSSHAVRLAQLPRIASRFITVQKDGSPRPRVQYLGAREAETVEIHFDLVGLSTGELTVVTAPEGAEVYVDYADTPVGLSPVTVSGLETGGSHAHTLLIRKDGFEHVRPILVDVPNDATTTVDVALSPLSVTGRTVRVHSIPPGAQLFVDYLPVTNVTDAMVADFSVGAESGTGWYAASHSVMLRKAGYKLSAPRYVQHENVDEELWINLIPDAGSMSDTDGDGLPDEWEESYDLNNLAPGQSGADDDPDGDGLSNNAERLAGTDPLDPDSAIRMVHGSVVSSTGQELTFTFRTVPGKTYRLRYADHLDKGWTDIGIPIMATDIQTTVTVQLSSETTGRFYRAAVYHDE